MSALLSLTLAVLTALPAPAPAPTLTGTTWVLQTLQPATPGPPAAAPITPGARLTRPTLTLTGRDTELTLGGSTGCSPLSGAARLGSAGALQTSALLLRGVQGGSSQNCPDAALSLREDYLTLLRATTRYDLRGDTLTLIAGKGRLTFTASPASSAVNDGGAVSPPTLNGPWTLTRLTVRAGNVERPVPTSGLLSVTFDGPQVTLVGSVGCNALRGTGALLGRPARVTFGPVSSTRMACAPTQAQAETALNGLLRAPLTVTQTGRTLTLSGAAGTLTLTRGPQPAPAPTVTDQPDPAATYVLTRVNGAPAPATARPVSLTFQGGRVGGVDGCNNVGAPYVLRGRVLGLTGPAFTTRLACPEPGVNLTGLLGGGPTLTLQGPGGSGQTLILTVPATPDAPAERWEFQAR
ncbi:META domain-containing protein [Deinococcus depolymerans]|uniref:DUF306 domain-containing protein n=1 Tax=Deinococcus depolymerans TaxID=392408 RepID=A0ABN1BIP8_9DEIO